MKSSPGPHRRPWHGASLSIPRTDPGRPRAVVEACWLVPEARLGGVVCAVSGEPTLFRSPLAEIAAARARDAFLGAWPDNPSSPIPERLHAAFAAADAAVRDENRLEKERHSPAWEATVEMAVLAGEGDAVWIAHIGACRAYRAEAGAWVRLTRDHSFAEEYPQHASDPAHRRVITRAFGLGRIQGPEIARHDASAEPFLLCTSYLAAVLDERPDLPALASPSEALSRLEEAARGVKDALWLTAVVMA